MKKLLYILILFETLSFQIRAQDCSFLVLGDLHYDQLTDHDLNWLRTKPDDLRQVTKEYTVYTEKYWDDFMEILKERSASTTPELKAIIQLGDLSEGLAGSEKKAEQMASNTMKALEATNMPVPWIITKGNHDITGPGAKEAFRANYIPFFRTQTGDPNLKSANYSYRFNNVLVVCIDPWNREEDLLAFLDHELSNSDAKFKFDAVHEPVIPVTERCWYVFKNDKDKRDSLLNIIAGNKAIVLCGHLHRYSVVSRSTEFGPIVQLMCISVIRDSNYFVPSGVITDYGPSLVENQAEWQPETSEQRKKILTEEAKFVSYYKQTDLPGYAIIKVNEEKEIVELEYYAAFGKEPYDTVVIADGKIIL